MATKEESLKFLDDARTAVENLQAMKLESEEKTIQLRRMKKNLESEQKTVNETIEETIKKRRAEVAKPFDNQISDLQSQQKSPNGIRQGLSECAAASRPRRRS